MTARQTTRDTQVTSAVRPFDAGPAILARKPPNTRATTLAGVLLLIGGATVLMGIITAEALYPAAYSTHHNTVSDLAAMRPENLVRQPSAAIFNWTLIVAGGLIATAAYFLLRSRYGRRTTIPVAILGLGMVGVGIFPGNHLVFHQLFSMSAFLAGGLGAVLTARLQKGPLRVIHIGLGLIALTFLILAVVFIDWAPAARLGEGGLERWVVYPVVLWVVVFGASLVTKASIGVQCGAAHAQAEPMDGRAGRPGQPR